MTQKQIEWVFGEAEEDWNDIQDKRLAMTSMTNVGSNEFLGSTSHNTNRQLTYLKKLRTFRPEMAIKLKLIDCGKWWL